MLRFSNVGSLGADGSNWENAFCNLHEALDVAVPGDEIWVAGETVEHSF